MVRMHIQCIDGQVVRREVQRLKHLFQRELFTVTEDDNVLERYTLIESKDDIPERAHVRVVPYFVFDESKQVFLVHAARVVNVRVDLSQVIKVADEDGINTRSSVQSRLHSPMRDSL